MTQVSGRILRKDVQKRIFELFFSSFTKVKSKSQAVDFAEDLLSPTERTTLAKRISIAFLLAKGYDYRSVSQVLGVSLGTVGKVSLKLKEKGSGYRWVIGQIKKEEGMTDLLNDLEGLFTALPPKGRNWSQWRKGRWEKELARRKAF